MKQRKANVLVVDDQENNRLVIEDILRKLKCKIKGVASGEEALIVLDEWVPDIILMDQMMPGLSGVETTTQIKKKPGFDQIPILMVTAKTEVATLKEAFDAGAVDYITKPVDRITLTARVNSALKTKFAFDEIRELTEQLQMQKRELTNFTHMVSHDLKSPVASAASLFDFFLYRIKDEHPHVMQDSSLAELLDRIPSAFKRMLGFVDTMLNYASAGKVVGDMKSEKMGDVIKEILQHFDHSVEAGHAVIHLSENMPSIHCDAVKVGQIWQNLIANAIKYRGETAPVNIQLGWESIEGATQFYVQDNGPGIAEEYRESVFRPFTRLADNVEGSGIGLATVERVINAHHGKIFIDPETTEGVKFVFEFPQT